MAIHSIAGAVSCSAVPSRTNPNAKTRTHEIAKKRVVNDLPAAQLDGEILQHDEAHDFQKCEGLTHGGKRTYFTTAPCIAPR